jgi:hypothetical protein
MNAFRRAAASLKASLSALPPPSDASTGSTPSSARVAALSVAIEQQGRVEMVSLRLEGASLVVTCTCGTRICAHAREALALFDGDDAHAAIHDDRITQAYEPAMRLSEPGPMPVMSLGAPPLPLREGRAAIAGALSDLVLAVTRSGLEQGISPAVLEALENLSEHAPPASSTGLRVFVGNLKTALEAQHSEGVVRALAAANAFIDALSTPFTTADIDARIATWLGTVAAAGVASERVTERSYLELAREQRPGLARAGVERRYLIDLESGELYREDRAAGDSSSVGPCPRVVTLGLAHIEPGLPPRRMRLLQYTTTPVIDGESWARIARFALPSFAGLPERYALHAQTGAELTDMLALIKPAGIEGDERALLRDHEGHALGLAGADGSTAVLQAFFESAEPEWMIGRVLQKAQSLMLVPLAVGGKRRGRPTHLQL